MNQPKQFYSQETKMTENKTTMQPLKAVSKMASPLTVTCNWATPEDRANELFDAKLPAAIAALQSLTADLTYMADQDDRGVQYGRINGPYPYATSITESVKTVLGFYVEYLRLSGDRAEAVQVLRAISELPHGIPKNFGTETEQG